MTCATVPSATLLLNPKEDIGSKRAFVSVQRAPTQLTRAEPSRGSTENTPGPVMLTEPLPSGARTDATTFSPTIRGRRSRALASVPNAASCVIDPSAEYADHHDGLGAQPPRVLHSEVEVAHVLVGGRGLEPDARGAEPLLDVAGERIEVADDQIRCHPGIDAAGSATISRDHDICGLRHQGELRRWQPRRRIGDDEGAHSSRAFG